VLASLLSTGHRVHISCLRVVTCSPLVVLGTPLPHPGPTPLRPPLLAHVVKARNCVAPGTPGVCHVRPGSLPAPADLFSCCLHSCPNSTFPLSMSAILRRHLTFFKGLDFGVACEAIKVCCPGASPSYSAWEQVRGQGCRWREKEGGRKGKAYNRGHWEAVQLCCPGASSLHCAWEEVARHERRGSNGEPRTGLSKGHVAWLLGGSVGRNTLPPCACFCAQAKERPLSGANMHHMTACPRCAPGVFRACFCAQAKERMLTGADMQRMKELAQAAYHRRVATGSPGSSAEDWKLAQRKLLMETLTQRVSGDVSMSHSLAQVSHKSHAALPQCRSVTGHRSHSVA